MSNSDCLDLVEDLERAATVEDLHAVCSVFCERFGFDFFHYGARLPTSFVRPDLIEISGFPQEWWRRYNEQGYVQIDPVVVHALTRVTPLRWGGVSSAERRDLAVNVRRFIDDASDFGITNGATFPIHGGQGEVALLSVVANVDAKEAKARIDRALAWGQLVSSYVHEAARRIFRDRSLALKRVELTPRERECLTWTAEGKTTWEIAQILGISERTVTFHLQNVTDKLEVSNRSHAVARAVTQQIILPQFN